MKTATTKNPSPDLSLNPAQNRRWVDFWAEKVYNKGLDYGIYFKEKGVPNMALVNGREVNFKGLNHDQIGKKILDVSGSVDGRGITIELTEEEKERFPGEDGSSPFLKLLQIVAYEIQERTGREEVEIPYIGYPNKVVT